LAYEILVVQATASQNPYSVILAYVEFARAMNVFMLFALQSVALSSAGFATPLRGNAALAQFRRDVPQKLLASRGSSPHGVPDVPKNEKVDELKKLSMDMENTDQNIESLSKIAGVPTTPPVMNLEDAPMFYFKSYWHVLSVNLIGTLLSVVTPVVMALLFGCCYKYYKEDPPAALPLGPEHNPDLLDRGFWRYNLCAFMSAPRFMCLLACCCPGIRWADTMRMAGITSFFTGIFLFAFLSSVASATAGLTGLILLCILTARRQSLRAMFQIPSGTIGTYLTDCCVYCWCPCCAIIQEARQMEEAYSVRHRIIERIPKLALRTK